MTKYKKRLAGFADEGSQSIEKQIALTKNLGWEMIELRNVDNQNICEMDDANFDKVYGKMQQAGIYAACFGSAIANWARSVHTPLEKDIGDLERAVPRMRKLGTNFIRIMSYPNDGLSEAEWKKIVLQRLSTLARIAEDKGVVLVLENCDGWASEKSENLIETMDTIASPALKIVFDTGNPISHLGTTEETWQWYRAALPYIVHFHIKDCKLDANGKPQHQYPGEGDSDVRRIIEDLVEKGYEGLFSIEPHIHRSLEQEQYDMYLKYGMMTNNMMAEILH